MRTVDVKGETMSDKERLQQQLDKLDEQNKRAHELYRELERSLALDELIPGVFEQGGVKILFSSVHPHDWPRGWSMLVTQGNGDQITIDLDDYAHLDCLDKLRPTGAYRNPLHIPKQREDE